MIVPICEKNNTAQAWVLGPGVRLLKIVPGRPVLSRRRSAGRRIAVRRVRRLLPCGRIGWLLLLRRHPERLDTGLLIGVHGEVDEVLLELQLVLHTLVQPAKILVLLDRLD